MPEEGKCTISRNVTFHEDKVFKDKVDSTPKASKQTNKGKRVSFNFDKKFEDSESVEFYQTMWMSLRVQNQKGQTAQSPKQLNREGHKQRRQRLLQMT